MLFALTALSALTAVAAQCQAPVSWPLPWVWPSQHHHREVEYDTTAGGYQNKEVHYDFTNRHLRYDMVYLDGPKKLSTILNFTSLWLNDTLYMYTWATVLSSTPQCVALDMGFGMMRPDWFLDANQSGLVWNAKKSDSFDIGYHRTVLTVKDAGQGGPADDEVFSYYYTLENNTDPAFSNGTPFLMHAPSPAGMVVNEYYDFEPRTYSPDEAAFVRPASPACIPAGAAATPREAHALLQAAGLARPPMVEVMLGGLNLGLPAEQRY